MATKVLILMAETGGGHRACAEALRAAFRERCGNAYDVTVSDLWSEEAPWPLNRVPRAYRPLVDGLPWLWRVIYTVGRKPSVVRPTLDLVWHWTCRRARAALERHRPRLVVSVHAMLQYIPLRVLSEWRRETGDEVPFVTVVTDLVSIHPVWYDPGVAICFVPTDEARHLALRAGLRPGQVRQRGLPIRAEFAHRAQSKRRAKIRLGLQEDLPLVLLVGGGEGMGRLAALADAVASRLDSDGSDDGLPVGQLAVVCGRNRRLEQRLRDRCWPVPTTVTGFVENLWDWMAASEFVITKAGPNTIMEACASGLPLLLSGYVPGQEEGNVRYVVRNGVGTYEADPARIAEIARSWLAPGRSPMQTMASRARKLGRPLAAQRIVDDIVAFAGAGTR